MYGYASGGIKSDRTLWQWGYGNAVGDGTTTNRSSPVSVVGNHSFKVFACGYYNSVGLKHDNTIWCWGGSNDYGQLGDGTVDAKTSPVSVLGNHKAVDVTCTYRNGNFLLKSDGSVWSWGYNSYGNLGDGSRINRSSPVSVVGNHTFVVIASSSESYNHAGALKANGECWVWGSDSNYGLGQSVSLGTSRSSPVSVIGNHAFKALSIGYSFNLALKADGTAWTWGGGGQNGETGDGTATYKTSPVSVIGNHIFIRIAVGADEGNSHSHCLGLKSDGTVWSWGGNSGGILGDGSTTFRSSPVSVVGNHSFVDISAGCYWSAGLKANGECWVWGSGGYGNLGDGTATPKSSPVSVIGNHSFVRLPDQEPVFGPVKVFVFKDKLGSPSTISLTWDGQVTYSPSYSTVYLQVYNQLLKLWENVDYDSSSSAGTDFKLVGEITADVSNYLDSNGWVTARVFQEIPS